MRHNHPPPDDDHPAQRPVPVVVAATASPPHGPTVRHQVRHLEKEGGWSCGERLRLLWYRLRLTVAEMNYATRRMVELQAPWITEDRRR